MLEGHVEQSHETKFHFKCVRLFDLQMPCNSSVVSVDGWGIDCMRWSHVRMNRLLFLAGYVLLVGGMIFGVLVGVVATLLFTRKKRRGATRSGETVTLLVESVASCHDHSKPTCADHIPKMLPSSLLLNYTVYTISL